MSASCPAPSVEGQGICLSGVGGFTSSWPAAGIAVSSVMHISCLMRVNKPLTRWRYHQYNDLHIIHDDT
jgi:hypothetical protein